MLRTLTSRAAFGLALALLAALPAHAQATKPKTGDKYALLVGVRQYDPNELRSLPYAEPDVQELGALLRDAGYRRVVTMTITDGTTRARLLPVAANVRKELAGLLEDCEPADTVLVVFAGHGVQFHGEDVNYFCPMDARLADRSTLISLKDVYRDLEACKAGTRLMMVDACRNDPQSDNSRSRSSVRLESVTRPQAKPPGGVAALFSCSEGQKAYEHQTLKHGVFFHFVIQGLKGDADIDSDGTIAMEELALYARKRVPAFVKDEYGPEVHQVPMLRGEVGGLAALVGLRANKAPEGTPTRTGGAVGAGSELASRSPERLVPDPLPPDAPRQITSATGMKLVLIPSGQFLMGSPSSEKDAQALEKPAHPVRITRPFYLGATEVTVGQFRRVVQSSGLRTEAEQGKGGRGWVEQANEFKQDLRFNWRSPGIAQGDDHPVVQVSWNDAIAFCNALSKLDGLKPYYQFGAGAQSGGDGYRLPTEAEWEYACRAGSQTRFAFGDDDASLGQYAWFYDNADGTTHPVGRKRANRFGLFDMHGNAWEWCWDGYTARYYKESPVDDPSGPPEPLYRMTRGGSYNGAPNFARSAFRTSFPPNYQDNGVGIRVARARSGQ